MSLTRRPGLFQELALQDGKVSWRGTSSRALVHENASLLEQARQDIFRTSTMSRGKFVLNHRKIEREFVRLMQRIEDELTVLLVRQSSTR